MLITRSRTDRTQVKGNIPLLAMIAAVISLGAFAFVIPAVSAQSTSTISTISTNVANVSIVSGAQNPNNGQFYDPANVTVVMGMNNTVVWTNNDSTNHTVVALDGSFSATLQPGQTFTHTFTVPGVYNYHCTIHPFMEGSVVVLAGSTASTSTATTSTSSNSVPEFPFGPIAVVVTTSLVLAAYLVARQTKRS